MTTLLLTGYDDAMQPIGDLTSPLMSDYAERHGMDFRCIREFADDSAPSWQKVKHVRQAFREGYGAVLWLDADTIVTNAEKTAPRAVRGLQVSLDWGEDANTMDFSMGNFLAFADTDRMWQEAEARADRYATGNYWEQGALREIYHTCDWAMGLVKMRPRRVFNAVPQEVHPSVVQPWQRGDWLCHLTMLSVPKRVALFHKITGGDRAAA